MKRAGTTVYPDVSDILTRKAEGRRNIARRSFSEKIAMMEQLRERLAPIKKAREQQMAGQTPSPDEHSEAEESSPLRRS